MVKIEKKNKTKILILMLILNTFCIFNFFFIEKTYGIDRSISVNKSIANIGEQVQIKIGISDKTAFYEHAKLYKVINGNSVFMGDYYEQAELVKINDILTEIGEIYYYVDYWYYVSSPTGGGDFNEYQRLSTATIQVSNDLTILNCDEYAIVGENIDLYWYIEDSPNVYSEYSELYCSINNQPFEKIATFYQIGCAHFQYMVDFAGVDYKFKVVNYGSNGDSSSSSVRIPYWQSGTKSFIAKQLIQFQDDLIPMSGHLTWDLFSLDWVLKDSVFNQFRHILEQGSFDKALEGAAAYLCSGLGTIIGIHMGILTSTIDSFLTTLTIETLWGVSTYISIEYIITRDDVSSIDLWNVAYSAAGGIKDKIIDKINHKMLEILHPLTLLTENQWSNFIDIYLDVYGWALFITARGYIQTQLGENSFNYINYGVDYILIFNPLITKLNHLANNYYIFSQNLKKQLTNEEITIEIDKILVNLTDIQTYLRTCRGLSKVVSDPIAIAIRNFIDKMVARLTALKPIKLTPISPSVLIDDSIILDIPFDEGEGYEVKDTNNNYVGTIGNSLDYGNSMVLDSDNWDNGLLKFENRGTYNGDFIYFDNISATPLGDPTGYDFTLQIDFYSESTNYHEYLLATGGQTSAIGICAVIDNIDKLVVNVHTQNAKFETPRSYIVPQNEWMTLTIRFHGKDSNIEDQYLEVYLNNTRIYYVDHGTSISGWNYGASNELCIGAPNGKPNYNYPVAHYFTGYLRNFLLFEYIHSIHNLDMPFDEGEGYEVKDTNNNYVGRIGNSLDYGSSMELDSNNWDNIGLRFENRGTYNGDFIYFGDISGNPLADPTGYDFIVQLDFYSEPTNYHEYLFATGGQTSAIGVCAINDNYDRLVVNVHTQNAKFETPRSYIVPQNEWMTLTIRFHEKDSNIEDQYLEVYLNNTRIYYVDHGTSISGWNYGASNELCIGAPNGKPNYNYPVAHYFTGYLKNFRLEEGV